MRTLGILKKITLLLLVLLLAQCGGKKSRSMEASDWTVLPEEPIVILGPTTDMNGNTVQGPWFSFRLAMSNSDTSDSITVLAIEIEVTGTDESGSPVKSNFSLSPSQFDHSYKSGDDEIQCKYYSFGTFAEGVSKQALSLYSGGTDTNCDRTPLFYLGGFPKKTEGASYRYTVKARPVGWFGTYASPKDRFDMSFRFTTK